MIAIYYNAPIMQYIKENRMLQPETVTRNIETGIQKLLADALSDANTTEEKLQSLNTTLSLIENPDQPEAEDAFLSLIQQSLNNPLDTLLANNGVENTPENNRLAQYCAKLACLIAVAKALSELMPHIQKAKNSTPDKTAHTLFETLKKLKSTISEQAPQLQKIIHNPLAEVEKKYKKNLLKITLDHVSLKYGIAPLALLIPIFLFVMMVIATRNASLFMRIFAPITTLPVGYVLSKKAREFSKGVGSAYTDAKKDHDVIKNYFDNIVSLLSRNLATALESLSKQFTERSSPSAESIQPDEHTDSNEESDTPTSLFFPKNTSQKKSEKAETLDRQNDMKKNDTPALHK